MTSKHEQILALARKQGVIRPRDLKPLGVSRTYLNYLASAGELVRSGRGIFTLAGYELTSAHSLVEAVRIQSKGVVCLLSALSYHRIGTQLPHQVWLAIPFGTRIAQPAGTPIRTVIMREEGYDSGIEHHEIEGTNVPVYSVSKTIADCFKFRGTVGLDVAIEALRDALRDRRCTREEIRQHARVLRVERFMRPYVETLSA